MSKLIRMDHTGHSTLAEWTEDNPEACQAAVREFRRQLDLGMWAAVPVKTETGRREAEMVRAFEDIPRTTDRVIFFPRAAGGAR